MRLQKLLSLVAVLATSACATTPFPYVRYTLQQNGRLFAFEEDGSKDRDIRDCLTKEGGSRCFVFFDDQYDKLRKDYADAVRRLNKCGKACK